MNKLNLSKGTNKDDLENILKEINNTIDFFGGRCLEKILAKKQGFGKHTRIEKVDLSCGIADTEFIDSGYDLRDTTSESLTVFEMCMSDEQWNSYIQQIKNRIEKTEKKRELDEKIKAEEHEMEKYIELKNKFERKSE